MPPEAGRDKARTRPVIAGVWAAVPTPFCPDGGFDRDAVARNADYFATALGLQGIFCNGLMGEGWALTVTERQAALEANLEGAAGRIGVGVVVTHHALAETLELARHAARAGAHHLVLMRPRAPFAPEELRGFVLSVAEAVSLPLVLFESAAPGMEFGKDLIVRLAEEGAIAAVKATQGLEAASRLRQACGGRALVTDPYEENWFENLERFGLTALYADPEPYLFQGPHDRPILAYTEAFQRGDIAEARGIHSALGSLRRVYRRWVLGPLKGGLAPNAALKLWCEHKGLAAGPVRIPLRPLGVAERESLLREIAEAESGYRAAFPAGEAREAAAWRS